MSRRAAVRALAGKELGDALRHRWLHLYAGLLAVLGVVIAVYAADDTAALALESYGRTAASMTNLCLLLAPLVALVMGAGSIAGERDRGTLDRLLAQPIGRGELLAGKALGLAASLVGATLAAFVPAALCLFALTGAPPPAVAAVFPAVAVLAILPALALGLLVSVTADSGGKALARGVLLWAWLVLLHDLLLLATLAAAKLGAGVLLAALLANPIHAARLLVVLALEPDLYLLGPAGALLSETLSPGGTAALLVAVLVAWTAAALAGAHLAFRLKPPRRAPAAADVPRGPHHHHHPREGVMNLVSKLLGRAVRGSLARLVLVALPLAALLALAGCGGGDASADGLAEAAGGGVHRVDDAMLARGAQVYQANCAPCHGAGGKGDGVGAASLDPKPRDHTNRDYMDGLTDASIAEVVKVGGGVRGFPNMPSHPHISGDDMVALVAFVRSLSRGAEAVETVEVPPTF